MKKYFAKYLVIEGEIKINDLFYDKKLKRVCKLLDQLTFDSSVWVEWKGGKTNIILTKEHKKVELFLCYYEESFKVGEKVFNCERETGTVVQSPNDGTVTDEENDKYFEINFPGRYLVGGYLGDEYFNKIVAPISPQAIWVKEDEVFDEDDWKLGLEYLGMPIRPITVVGIKMIDPNGILPLPTYARYVVLIKSKECNNFH